MNFTFILFLSLVFGFSRITTSQKHDPTASHGNFKTSKLKIDMINGVADMINPFGSQHSSSNIPKKVSKFRQKCGMEFGT